MEAAAGLAIPALCSAAAGRVGSYGTSLLPQCRERHNEIPRQKAGANSFYVGESGRRRTRKVGLDQQKEIASSEGSNRKGKQSSRGK
jgi:hypothetical protein